MTARPARRRPRVPPAVLRVGARLLGRRCLNPALTWPVQRTRLDQLTKTSLLPRGTTITEQQIAGLRAEVVAAPGSDARRTVVHFHGGGYCVGSALTPRSWAAHLSARAGTASADTTSAGTPPMACLTTVVPRASSEVLVSWSSRARCTGQGSAGSRQRRPSCRAASRMTPGGTRGRRSAERAARGLMPHRSRPWPADPA